MIMSKIKSAIRLAKNIRTTGAINQTSRRCELEICSKVSGEANKVYAEFGAGPGNITREILSRLHPDSQLYTFEVNKEFCDRLANDIKDSRLHIINDSASNIEQHIPNKVDGIISSLPLTIIPKEVRLDIIHNAYHYLKDEGYYSQIMYSTYLKNLLYDQFDKISRTRLFSFPIENIFHCQKN